MCSSEARQLMQAREKFPEEVQAMVNKPDEEKTA